MKGKGRKKEWKTGRERWREADRKDGERQERGKEEIRQAGISD